MPGNGREVPLKARLPKERLLSPEEAETLGIPSSELVISPASARKSRPTPASATKSLAPGEKPPEPSNT
jgi:hypothetical protein